jgi:hypothetical protein
MLSPQTSLILVGGEDDEEGKVDEAALALAGAVFEVRAEGLGHITLFQPDAADEYFHMGISSNTEGRGSHFDQLAETADTLAGCLGMVIDYDDELKERLDELAARGPQVDVVSVRVEIGLGKGKPRLVAIEGSALAKVEESKLEALDVATLRAVSFALSGSSHADGRATLEQLVEWAADADLKHDHTEDNMAFFDVVDEDGDELDLPRISFTLSERDIDISAFPDLEIEHQEGLERNYVHFSGPAKLALDKDGDWNFASVIRREKLDRAFFLEVLSDFKSDLEDLVANYGVAQDEDEEDEAEGAEGEGEEDEENDEGEEDEGLSLEDLVTWAVRGDYERKETKEDFAWIEHVDDEGDNDLPTISVFVFNDHVHIVAYPELDLALEDALRQNDQGFTGAARLAVDKDGDWAFRTALPVHSVDETSFLAALDAFSADLASLIQEHAPEDEDDGRGAPN